MRAAPCTRANRTKVGLKLEQGSGVEGRHLRANRTKVGLKPVVSKCTTDRWAAGANRTKVGLKLIRIQPPTELVMVLIEPRWD